MANTVGRNDPCPCGSGKKYKKCCLGKENTTAAATLAAVATAQEQFYAEIDEIDACANHVVHLIDDRRFAEAEAAARDLVRRFPDSPDGQEKLAMVYEARGERSAAHDAYVDLNEKLPSLKDFRPDPEYLKWLRDRIAATAD